MQHRKGILSGLGLARREKFIWGRQREQYQSGNNRGLNNPESDGQELNVQDQNGVFIGKNAVEKEHIQKLTEIGMIWENMDSWERRFALAERYYKEHGNLRIPNNYVVEGVWLERWLREQKARIAEEMESSDAKKEKKHRRPLNEKQKQKLTSIGVQMGMSQAERSWREQYREAEEFYAHCA